MGGVSGRGLRDHPEEFISMQEYDILKIEFLFKYAPPPPPYAHTHTLIPANGSSSRQLRYTKSSTYLQAFQVAPRYPLPEQTAGHHGRDLLKIESSGVSVEDHHSLLHQMQVGGAEGGGRSGWWVGLQISHMMGDEWDFKWVMGGEGWRFKWVM